MAYVRLVRGRYRVEVEVVGHPRESATFDSKVQARNWGADREAALRSQTSAPYPAKTIRDALDKYKVEVSPKKAGKRWEEFRLDAIERQLGVDADVLCRDAVTPILVRWRDLRLQTVSSGTVQREVNLLRNVFTIARDEWHWLGHDPFKGFTAPGDNPPRDDKRVDLWTARRICRWLGYQTGTPPQTKQQEVAYAFLISLRNAMRSGEILQLGDRTVDFTKRVATVKHKMQYRTKKPREVPLLRQTLRLLSVMRGKACYFTVDDEGRDALFRKARDSLMIEDLHFHDSRGEALTRLSRQYDVLTLSRISGIKDLNLLNRVYYRESAASVAARL